MNGGAREDVAYQHSVAVTSGVAVSMSSICGASLISTYPPI